MIIHYERDKRHDFLRRSFWKGEITKRNGKIHKAAQILFKDTVPVLGGGHCCWWLVTSFTELLPPFLYSSGHSIYLLNSPA